MKVIIVNGSPRMNGNTAILCKAFQSGVMSVYPDSKVSIHNLNALAFKGCQSCFSCKLKDGKSYGRCVINDQLKPILAEILSVDCLVVASPIYLMDVTSSTKAFLERLCFSLGSYEQGYKSLAPKRLKVVTIYTMNTTPEFQPLSSMENIDMFLGHIFSSPERLCSYNTYQFIDYSKYVVEVFDEKEKTLYRKRNFHKDVDTSYNLGKKIAQQQL